MHVQSRITFLLSLSVYKVVSQISDDFKKYTTSAAGCLKNRNPKEISYASRSDSVLFCTKREIIIKRFLIWWRSWRGTENRKRLKTVTIMWMLSLVHRTPPCMFMYHNNAAESLFPKHVNRFFQWHYLSPVGLSRCGPADGNQIPPIFPCNSSHYSLLFLFINVLLP